MPAANLVIPEYEHYDELQGNHRAFVDRYLECGDSIRAAELAGYKDTSETRGGATIKAKANRLRRELAHIIDQRMEGYARGTDMVLLGVNVLKQLAQTAESETVRLNAAKEIVNRCLAPQTQKQEVTHKVMAGKLDDDALEKRIEHLRQELNGNVIDVTPEETTDA